MRSLGVSGWRKATSTGVTRAVKSKAAVVARSQYAINLFVRGSMIHPRPRFVFACHPAELSPLRCGAPEVHH